MQIDSDAAIQQWKVKNLIKNLSEARGNGTSMISLIIPPKDQISRISKLLSEELGTATNIKSRVNRLSVLGAITSAVQKLKLYKNVPPNGLVLYCGTVITEDGKEKKLNIDFEPYKPINTKLYLCDNKFHTQALKELLENNDSFGFIIMDGHGCLFGTLCGNNQRVVHKFTVDLPKKHGRGGQSALRFARLRTEKRHNYIRKVAENTTSLFISNDIPNVTGLVLAGSASFKTELANSDLFDSRLKPIIIKMIDVSYGGENGFNQAIELSTDALSDVKFIYEKKLLSQFMNEIALDTGKYCFGIKDTMSALEMGAIKTLIVWESLDITRFKIRNNVTEETKIIYLDNKERKESSNFKDKKSGISLDVIENISLLEWLADNYKNFGSKLELVTNRSQEGSQFCKGFGGIGGLLRYTIDFDVVGSDSDNGY